MTSVLFTDPDTSATYYGEVKTTTKTVLSKRGFPEELAVHTPHGTGALLRYPYIHTGSFVNGESHGEGRIWLKESCKYGEIFDVDKYCEGERNINAVLVDGKYEENGYKCIHSGIWNKGRCQ